MSDCGVQITGYTAKEAIKKLIDSASAKFAESVDISVVLNVDVRKSEEQIRGIVFLPKGLGKVVSVAVFAKDPSLLNFGDFAPDVCGGEDLIEEIKAGKSLKVDWCVTTPDFMPNVSKIAKILGPKGLMPNPKLETVTSDIVKKVKDLKGGYVAKYKTDKSGIVHARIGNIKFSVDDLADNFDAIIQALKQAKPSTVKGGYFKDVFLTSTMGKSFRVLLDHKE